MADSSAAKINATDLIRSMSVADLRERIDSIDCERKALLTLLRAAIRAQKSHPQPSQPKGGRDAQ